MNEITITTLSPSEWQPYRELRLQALINDPVAFTGNYDETAVQPESYWQERLREVEQGKNNKLFAKVGEKVVGMLILLFEENPKIKHVGYLVSVYVDPEYRGQGVGAKLLTEIISQAKNNSELRKIKLEVTANNTAAIRLYEKIGFTVVGKLREESFVAGQYYDHLLMELFLQ